MVAELSNLLTSPVIDRLTGRFHTDSLGPLGSRVGLFPPGDNWILRQRVRKIMRKRPIRDV